MSTYHFTIGGKDYTGETASAKEQFQALHLATNSRLILCIKEDMSEKAVVLGVMSMSWSDLQTLEKLLVKDKVVRDSDEVPVGPNLFRDNPAGYALLVGKAAQANLSAFYQLSGGKNADAGELNQAEM